MFNIKQFLCFALVAVLVVPTLAKPAAAQTSSQYQLSVLQTRLSELMEQLRAKQREGTSGGSASAVQAGYGVPTVKEVSAPRLALTRSGNEETSLTATARIAISAPARQSVYLPINGKDGSVGISHKLYLNKEATNSPNSAKVTAKLENPRLNTTPCNPGQECYLIPAGRTAYFTVNFSVNPLQLFAGSYAVQLSNVTYLSGLRDSAGNYVYTSANWPSQISNSVTVIGEKSPYITGTNSPVQPGEVVKVRGVRMANSKVSFSTQYRPEDINFSADGTELSFKTNEKEYQGNYVLKLTDPQTGESNQVYVLVERNVPVPAQDLSLSNTGGRVEGIDNGSNRVATATVEFMFTVTNNRKDLVAIAKDPNKSISYHQTAASGRLYTLTTHNPNLLAGDSAENYVIPSGSSRTFSAFGDFGNNRGVSGVKEFKLDRLYYGSTTNPTGKFISLSSEKLGLSYYLYGNTEENSVAYISGRLSPTTPAARVVNTSRNGVTDKVILGVFDLKSADVNSTITALNFDFNWDNQDSFNSIFKNLELVDGFNVYSATRNDLGGVFGGFANLNIKLSANQWKSLTLRATVADADEFTNGVKVNAGLFLGTGNIIGIDDLNYELIKIDPNLNNKLIKANNVTFLVGGSNPTNLPPVISKVSGPTTLKVGEKGTWAISASDPENGSLTYSIDWGEGILSTNSLAKISNVQQVQQTSTFTHVYNQTGNYTVKIKVIDDKGLTVESSQTVVVGSGPDVPIPVPMGGNIEVTVLNGAARCFRAPCEVPYVGDVSVILYDASGKTILDKAKSYAGSATFKSLKPGTYLVKAEGKENETAQSKVVVKPQATAKVTLTIGGSRLRTEADNSQLATVSTFNWSNGGAGSVSFGSGSDQIKQMMDRVTQLLSIIQQLRQQIIQQRLQEQSNSNSVATTTVTTDDDDDQGTTKPGDVIAGEDDDDADEDGDDTATSTQNVASTTPTIPSTTVPAVETGKLKIFLVSGSTQCDGAACSSRLITDREVRVYLYRDGKTTTYRVTNGYLELNLAPGKYGLTASADEYSTGGFKSFEIKASTIPYELRYYMPKSFRSWLRSDAEEQQLMASVGSLQTILDQLNSLLRLQSN